MFHPCHLRVALGCDSGITFQRINCFHRTPALCHTLPDITILPQASRNAVPDAAILNVEESCRTVDGLRSPRRSHVGPPYKVGVLERPLLLPRRYPTLSPMPVTIITITPFLGQFGALVWDIGYWGGRRHDQGLLM